MSDLKLFSISDGTANELTGASMALEKSLQDLIEANMETLFGVRFLASEYSTGAVHGGRMDSIGLDENASPVIFEYKRAVNENVINQGLFYLDWLMDHRADFKLLVMDRLDRETADAIDWRNPRLVFVANGFTKYDEYAVKQFNRSIDLVRYRDFEGSLLALELVASAKTDSKDVNDAPAPVGTKRTPTQKTVVDLLDQSPTDVKDLYSAIEAFCEGLGDDVSTKTLKLYFSFRRLKNFACVELHPQNRAVLVYVKVDPDSIALESGFSRDVRNIGHFGTGELELRITDRAQLEKAFPLIQRSYDAN